MFMSFLKQKSYQARTFLLFFRLSKIQEHEFVSLSFTVKKKLKKKKNDSIFYSNPKKLENHGFIFQNLIIAQEI